jgi:uncharacterized protein (UPF0333 family)
MKKAQISVEYLVVVGFVTLAVITILGVGMVYSQSIKDQIKVSQMENFANKVISTSEEVFYPGSPSKATITAYLPEGIKSIVVSEENMKYSLVISLETSSGTIVRAFPSNVPISISNVDTNPGVKNFEINATEADAVIGQV